MDYDAWLENLIEHVQRTPPACLAAVRATPVISGPWNHNARWSLACPCGCELGLCMGFPCQNPDVPSHRRFACPLAFGCPSCGRETVFFDSKFHGYDAAISPGGVNQFPGIREEGPKSAAACKFCGATLFALIVSFTHSHFDIIEDEPDLAPQAQDYFDWFVCAGVCVECGRESCLSDYETA